MLNNQLRLKRAQNRIRKLSVRIKSLEEHIEELEVNTAAAVYGALHTAEKVRAEKEEERRRRFDLEQEFELAGYKHFTRKQATKIKGQYLKACTANGMPTMARK